jgi:hypothetical protein
MIVWQNSGHGHAARILFHMVGVCSFEIENVALARAPLRLVDLKRAGRSPRLDKETNVNNVARAS